MREDHRQLLNSKPLARMRYFASLLGWNGLQLEYKTFSPDEIAKYGCPATGILTYYMTTDFKFNLQINEVTTGQALAHQATIKADRYGICNIGWHPFDLSENDQQLMQEVERLRPWLDRQLYKNASWRRTFKRKFPEMLLPSQKKKRGSSHGSS